MLDQGPDRRYIHSVNVNVWLVSAGRNCTQPVCIPNSVASAVPIPTGGNKPITTPSRPVISSRASKRFGHQRIRPLVTGGGDGGAGC